MNISWKKFIRVFGFTLALSTVVFGVFGAGALLMTYVAQWAGIIFIAIAFVGMIALVLSSDLDRYL